jgi:hypothetical protein
MTTVTPTEAAAAIQEITEEIGKAVRTSVHAYLDASDNILNAVVAYQQEVRAGVEQKWVADAIGAQADATRELIKFNAAQREHLA